MKTLLLLRHARSAKDPNPDDHERPLTKKGKEDAKQIGRLLPEQALVPELILASTARRCRKTAEPIIAASGYRGEVRFSGQLYEADGSRLRDYLAGLDDQFQRVLLVGHNPGLEELLKAILGMYKRLMPGALAHLELPIDGWRELAANSQGQLIHLWSPE